MDSVLECSSLREPSATYTSVCCCVALLQSLETLCLGRMMPAQYVERINSLYARLEEADYTGRSASELQRTYLRLMLPTLKFCVLCYVVTFECGNL